MRRKALVIWIFIIYGIPSIWVTKPRPEQNKWFIIQSAWRAAKLTLIVLDKRKKEND